mmetsp:Transcript_34041/g.75023  ORF Transcript_34041/g.75023 Transcript_34041/m.75023 type:complete len:468 (-) Transcript_34041:161-1564(-)
MNSSWERWLFSYSAWHCSSALRPGARRVSSALFMAYSWPILSPSSSLMRISTSVACLSLSRPAQSRSLASTSARALASAALQSASAPRNSSCRFVSKACAAAAFEVEERVTDRAYLRCRAAPRAHCCSFSACTCSCSALAWPFLLFRVSVLKRRADSSAASASACSPRRAPSCSRWRTPASKPSKSRCSASSDPSMCCSRFCRFSATRRSSSRTAHSSCCSRSAPSWCRSSTSVQAAILPSVSTISPDSCSFSLVHVSLFSRQSCSSLLDWLAACRCAACSISSALRSLALACISFLVLDRASSALVYLVDSNTSSNFFFSTMPSCMGQLQSSWCTKMTFSRMAGEIPRFSGMTRSMSEHFIEMLTFSPCALVVRSTPSSALNSSLDFFFSTCSERTATQVCPDWFWKRSLICALTLVESVMEGSFTRLWPLFDPPGGSAPVQANLRLSMMVVFPHPFAPTIIVSGE